MHTIFRRNSKQPPYEHMNAVVIHQAGGPEILNLED